LLLSVAWTRQGFSNRAPADPDYFADWILKVKSLPYFRWWVARATTDEKYSSMTDEELGFYHRCLNVSWVNIGLPAELPRFARLLRISLQDLERLWLVVGQCWYEKDGRFFNYTQEEERAYVIAKSEQGTHAVKSRKDRSTPVQRKHNSSTTTDLPRAYDSVCVFSTSSLSVANQLPLDAVQRKTCAADMNAQAADFEVWWKAWSSVRGNPHRDAAARSFISYVTCTNESAALECTSSYIAGPGADPAHGYRPDNFLAEMARDGFATRWPAPKLDGGRPRRLTPTEEAIAEAKERRRHENAT
jgi:uncharacterized protein YdaU (DUF1376 family)